MAKIMIVDDADFMRMMIRENLTTQGYDDFLEAANGEEAIEKYCENRPDLVLLDITMPKKDGIEVLGELRKYDPDARVIMCSSHGEESMIMKAVKLGARDFIVKPFKPERLTQTVKNVLLNA